MPEKFISVNSETNSLNEDLACQITRKKEKITMTFTGFKSEEDKMPHKFVTIDSETNSLNDDLACEISRSNEKITMTFTGFKSEEEIINFYNVQLLLWSAESLPEKLN